MYFTNAYERKEFMKILQTKICPNFVANIRPLEFDKQTKYFVKDGIHQLGNIKFDDKEVIVIEIQQVSCKDPRITLTKDAFKLLHDHQKDDALMVFYSKDTDSWRFSLLTSKYEGRDKINSSPRRYSFLLGPHEKVRTPNDKLISEGITKSFEELEKKFDVEVVRKEFFKQYLNLFLELYKELKVFEKSIDNKNDIVTLTKNLMGKIIFLYFIQKKGRLGVHAEKDRGEGKKDFMKFLFEDYKGPKALHKGEHKHSFYNDYLEPLFYEALSNERESDVYERFGIKIPYLNGGLFEQDYDWENTIINPSDEVFEKIIDTFDRYNFTIHEDDPYDREVAVDPEMLGKIFETMISVSKDNIENILALYQEKKEKEKDHDKIINVDVGKELNKKFGAFYTPREIVHYMTQESIINYLINGIKKEEKDKTEQSIEGMVRALFSFKERHLNKEEIKSQEGKSLEIIKLQTIEPYVKLVNDLLKDLKVLDPAVGSGAFPMGILHEIFGLRRYLIDNFDLKHESDYYIKKSIIQNNIYGIDIEPGAVDIARLRFRLSLVVDGDRPEPLPNLDFKFVCANSLIPLEKSRLFTSHDVIEELNQLQKKYFNCQSKKEKEELKKMFEQTKLKFWGAEEGKRIFSTTKEYKQYIADIAGKATDLRNKQIMNREPFDAKKSSDFFDSELVFGIKGFDIVIGNPPYTSKLGKDEKELLGKVYPAGKKKKRFDLYNFFMIFATQILSVNGVSGFIVPQTRLLNKGSLELRKSLLLKGLFKIDILGGDIFETAIVDTLIYFLQGKKKESIEIGNGSIENGYFKVNNQKEIITSESIGYALPFNQDEAIDKIFTKCCVGSKPIGIISKIVFGIQTRKDKNSPTYLHEKIVNTNCKQVINGKDMGKYFYIKQDLFVEYGDRLWNKRDQKIFESPEKILLRQVGARPICAYDDKQIYTLNTIYNIVVDDAGFLTKYVLGIINSTLIAFLWKAIFPEAKDVFPRIKKEDFVKIPIKEIPIPDQKLFVAIVDQILAKKKKNPQTDTSELERKIDTIVYKLYGLTYDEVKKIDSGFVMIKEKYDKFSW